MRSVWGAGTEMVDRIERDPWLYAVGATTTAVTLLAVGLAWLMVQAATPPPESVAAERAPDPFGLGPGVDPGTLAAAALVVELLRATTLGIVLGLALPVVRASDRRSVDLGSVLSPGEDGWRRVQTFLGGAYLFRAVGGLATVATLVAVGGVYLALATGVQAGGYAAGADQEQLMVPIGFGLVGVLAVAATVGVGATGLLGGELARTDGYRRSLRTTLARAAGQPHRLLAHGFVLTVLWLLPFVTGALLAEMVDGTAGLALGAVGFLAVGVLVYTFRPAYRLAAVDTPDDADADADRRGGRSGDSRTGTGRTGAGAAGDDGLPVGRRRLVVAAVLVVALVAGAVHVRTTELRPTDPPDRPGFDADRPGASLDRSLSAGVGTEFAVETTIYEWDPADSDRVVETRVYFRYDHDGRQAEAYSVGPAGEEGSAGNRGTQGRGLYATESTLLFAGVESRTDVSTLQLSAIRSSASDWEWRSRESLKRYGDAAAVSPPIESFEVRQATGWRVVDRSGGRIVLAVGGEAFVSSFSDESGGFGEELVDGSARVTVDADTGYVLRTNVTTVSNVTEREWVDGEYRSRSRLVRSRTVTTVDYGDVDVTRPPAAGPPRVLERLLDVVYY